MKKVTKNISKYPLLRGFRGYFFKVVESGSVLSMLKTIEVINNSKKWFAL
jgi:hypothetical protein